LTALDHATASTKLCPYTPLFRSENHVRIRSERSRNVVVAFGGRYAPVWKCYALHKLETLPRMARVKRKGRTLPQLCALSEFNVRSEEHTSELQSRENLVCRLLLE